MVDQAGELDDGLVVKAQSAEGGLVVLHEVAAAGHRRTGERDGRLGQTVDLARSEHQRRFRPGSGEVAWSAGDGTPEGWHALPAQMTPRPRPDLVEHRPDHRVVNLVVDERHQ